MSSTLVQKLNAGNKRGAAAEFARWINAGGHPVAGLIKRRAAEAAMFRGELSAPQTL
jgi:lysozyme